MTVPADSEGVDVVNASRAFTETEFLTSSWSVPDKDCVGVACRPDRVAIRDTKTAFGSADDGHLEFSREAFNAFLQRIA